MNELLVHYLNHSRTLTSQTEDWHRSLTIQIETDSVSPKRSWLWGVMKCRVKKRNCGDQQRSMTPPKLTNGEIHMNSKERKKLARAIAHRAERNKDISLARNVASALVGNTRVAKALSLIEYKACPRPVRESTEGGAMCLPEVAMFNAGNRSEKYKNPYHVMKG